MTQFRRLLFSVFALASLAGTAVQARAEENAPHEPWKFDGEIMKRGDHTGTYDWEIMRMDSDDKERRKDKDGKELRIYGFRTKGIEDKETFEKTIAKKHKVDKADTEIEKDIIAIVNKFNKLDGAKAISKVDIQSQYFFEIKQPGDHLITAESEKQAFYRFMTLKHQPIALESLDRNAKDESRTRDSCTVLVRYEHNEVETIEERNKLRRAAREKGEELPKFGLKAEVLYLDESQGDISHQVFMDKEGNWERMMSR